MLLSQKVHIISKGLEENLGIISKGLEDNLDRPNKDPSSTMIQTPFPVRQRTNPSRYHHKVQHSGEGYT